MVSPLLLFRGNTRPSLCASVNEENHHKRFRNGEGGGGGERGRNVHLPHDGILTEGEEGSVQLTSLYYLV